MKKLLPKNLDWLTRTQVSWPFPKLDKGMTMQENKLLFLIALSSGLTFSELTARSDKHCSVREKGHETMVENKEWYNAFQQQIPVKAKNLMPNHIK